MMIDQYIHEHAGVAVVVIVVTNSHVRSLTRTTTVDGTMYRVKKITQSEQT